MKRGRRHLAPTRASAGVSRRTLLWRQLLTPLLSREKRAGVANAAHLCAQTFCLNINIALNRLRGTRRGLLPSAYHAGGGATGRSPCAASARNGARRHGANNGSCRLAVISKPHRQPLGVTAAISQTEQAALKTACIAAYVAGAAGNRQNNRISDNHRGAMALSPGGNTVSDRR